MIIFTAENCTVEGAPLICQGFHGEALLVGIENWREKDGLVVYTRMATDDMADSLYYLNNISNQTDWCPLGVNLNSLNSLNSLRLNTTKNL